MLRIPRAEKKHSNSNEEVQTHRRPRYVIVDRKVRISCFRRRLKYSANFTPSVVQSAPRTERFLDVLCSAKPLVCCGIMRVRSVELSSPGDVHQATHLAINCLPSISHQITTKLFLALCCFRFAVENKSVLDSTFLLNVLALGGCCLGW